MSLPSQNKDISCLGHLLIRFSVVSLHEVIWAYRLLTPGWLLRVDPLHLFQSKGSGNVWTLCCYFMVSYLYHIMCPCSNFQNPDPITQTYLQGRLGNVVFQCALNKNGTGKQRASLCPTPGNKTLKTGCTIHVGWLAHIFLLP